MAAVALGFPAVHGITLGFGVTLIGEAVDYSIYLFVQGAGTAHGDWRRQRSGRRSASGALTSIAGFAALLPSDFQGLAQLGLYSVAGLAAAALATRYVLPAWLPAQSGDPRPAAPRGPGCCGLLQRLRRARAALRADPAAAPGRSSSCIAARSSATSSRRLSPVPAAEQDFDEQLRADLGAPDVRYMVLASAPRREGRAGGRGESGAAPQPAGG